MFHLVELRKQRVKPMRQACFVSTRVMPNIEAFELLCYLDDCIIERNQVHVPDFIHSLGLADSEFGVSISLEVPYSKSRAICKPLIRALYSTTLSVHSRVKENALGMTQS